MMERVTSPAGLIGGETHGPQPGPDFGDVLDAGPVELAVGDVADVAPEALAHAPTASTCSAVSNLVGHPPRSMKNPSSSGRCVYEPYQR